MYIVEFTMDICNKKWIIYRYLALVNGSNDVQKMKAGVDIEIKKTYTCMNKIQ